MRLASRATLLVYRAVAQSLREGMTTGDVRGLIAAAYRRVGFEVENSPRSYRNCPEKLSRRAVISRRQFR